MRKVALNKKEENELVKKRKKVPKIKKLSPEQKIIDKMLSKDVITEKDDHIINGYFNSLLEQETLTDTFDNNTITIPKIIIYNLIKSKLEVKKLFIGESSLYILYMKGYSNNSRPNESHNEDEIEEDFDENRILKVVSSDYINELVPNFVKVLTKNKYAFEN